MQDRTPADPAAAAHLMTVAGSYPHVLAIGQIPEGATAPIEIGEIPPDLARAAVASPMQPHFALQSATGHLVSAMRVSDGDRVTSGVDPVAPPQRPLLYLVMDLAAAESAER
ncbi:hypothetical protein, partial [Thiocapsa sp.]|uniref:hypothetical protein n=1 Tax=Thiocapsa sp. TaxID=2024551 RepID=UPI0035942988